VSTSYYPKSVKACAMRVTQLDSCDQPYAATAAKRRVTSPLFTLAKLTIDLEAAAPETVKNACDTVIIDDPGTAHKKGFNVELVLIGMVYPALALLIDAQELLDVGGAAVGGVIAPPTRVSYNESAMIELWTRNGTAGACVPGQAISGQYTRWLLPKTSRWELSGDITFDKGAMLATIKGYATNNPNWVPGMPSASFPTWTASPAGGQGPWSAAGPEILPPGEVADPWTPAHQTKIRAGGELAWIADSLPDLTSPSDYMPVTS
jgi:hypothetical protein